MSSFANSPKLFATTCARLFARMIDTVPKGVKLTEVIEPLPAKPQGVQVTVLANSIFTREYPVLEVLAAPDFSCTLPSDIVLGYAPEQ
jgi:hypothetical protein